MGLDIVERLRNYSYEPEFAEAADTIETLRARVSELEANAATMKAYYEQVFADGGSRISELKDQLAAQALTIKTMREALDNLTQYNSSDKTVSVLAKYVKQGREALAIPDNSTEILQEWFDKQLGDPVAFIRVSDEEDRLDGRDYEGHSLTNFVDPCGFQVFRKPEIKK